MTGTADAQVAWPRPVPTGWRASDEVEALRDGAAVVRMLGNHAVMRDLAFRRLVNPAGAQRKIDLPWSGSGTDREPVA